MRIGLDAREAWREEPRGIGLYVRHLIREFGQGAADREFLLYHRSAATPGGLDLPPNMRPVRADMPGDRWHTWERVLMPWRMRRDRLDVYHGTYNTIPPSWRLWKGPPMVVTLHDTIVTWWPDDLGDPFVRYARAVTRRVVRDAAAILTVSEWSKKDICERFDCDPARVHITWNGLHPDFLAGPPAGAAEVARMRFAGGRPYLFGIGAPLARKNTARLIEAFGVLASRKSCPHLLLLSGLSGHAQRFAEVAAAAGCAERVRFLPYLPRADLVALYAGADLSVYPSLVEGFGIPVLESLAVGTPVAASNTSAIPEAGGEHASYFDPESTESMASAIEAALYHRAEFDLVRDRAIERARGFTWARTAQAVLKVYEKVAR
ncbi:MAG: glycosyltransferase family 1 protein [Planctomycetota bacterium]